MGDLSPNFSKKEFECYCCKKVIINLGLIYKLERIREAIGNLPITIIDGYRCKEYNDLIDGDPNSAHLTGEGADIETILTPIKLALRAETVEGIRIGIYPKHIHIDIRPVNPSRFWYVKKYGNPIIYSKNITNLDEFLKKVGVRR
jgi:uncharacterized protein YcbK (DUF882 family)